MPIQTGSFGLTPISSATNIVQAQSMLGRARAILRVLGSGFAAEPIAACVPPGTRLLLCDITPRIQQACGVGSIEEVTFTQLTATAYEYRDAVRFHNGHEMLIQGLEAGQRARVLQISLTDEFSPAVEAAEVIVPSHTGLDFIAPRSFGSSHPWRELYHE